MTMPINQRFSPNWISAPGDTILDILEERGIGQGEFARQLGQSHRELANLLEGRTTITIAIARQLEHILGGSIEFWMARDLFYRQDIERLHKAEERTWLKSLPLGDMIKFGWIKPAPLPMEEVSACLNFFGVESIDEWRRSYSNLQQLTVFRTSLSLDSNPAAVAAWLRQGEIEAEKIHCASWNSEAFQSSFPLIRSLTREKDPQKFLPKLQEICANSGVAVAVVRAPSGCRASGATRFLSQDKALLLLSFRYRWHDQFWFTFFHEAAHLILHSERGFLLNGERGFFLEGVDLRTQAEENEANEYAAQTLIPLEYKEDLMKIPLELRSIARFARKLDISPGIVVSQLQRLQRLDHNQLNKLRYRFSENS